VAAAIAANLNINSDDVPTLGDTSRKFLCQCTLERCLNKAVGDMLPTDAILYKKEYMKITTKPKKLIAKQWINRLGEMKEMLYRMDNTN